MLSVRARAPRIALVIDRFDGRRGGAALWTRGYAAWLAARECDVHVLARGMGPAEGRLPLTFHAIDPGRSPLAFAAAVATRLKAIEPLVSHDMGAAYGCDVFQPHVGTGQGCWEGSVASYPAWLRPVKRLCGHSTRYRRLRELSAAQYRGDGGSAVFVAVSQKVARDMVRLHDVPPDRIRVVYNGVDLSRFAPATNYGSRREIRRGYGIGDDELLIIAVAHHRRLKGTARLADAVRRLRREGDAVRLLVCGGRRGLAAATPARGDVVVNCGPVDDVAPLYAAADLCAHPTYYDACSLVALEAMAAGLPLVTTSADGASELITPEVDGIVLDRCDESALVGALRWLVRSATLRRALGRAARRLAEEHPVERNYHEIVAAYGDALELRGEDRRAVERVIDGEASTLRVVRGARRAASHSYVRDVGFGSRRVRSA